MAMGAIKLLSFLVSFGILGGFISQARALAFSDESLLPHNGVVGQLYTFELKGRVGGPPYSYAVTGNLPPGLMITKRGLISGRPTTAGKFQFWCDLSDSFNAHSQREITIDIADAKGPIVPAGPSK